jgi:hypothetical protein
LINNEYITLEFYELGDDDKVIEDDDTGDMLMYASDVSFVPRIGDKLKICRTEKILGLDPVKEHRDFQVIDVEIWYNKEMPERSPIGVTRQIAVFVRRIPESMGHYR